jgi:two-component sensor histidine kinase
MRTSLRHREVALDDFVDAAVDGEPTREAEPPRSELLDRATLQGDWQEYIALPTYPGERELQPAVIPLLDELNGSVDRIFAALRAHSPIDARTIMNAESKPAFDRLDDGLRHLVALNSGAGQDEAKLIGQAHRKVRVLGAVFDVVCTLLSVFTGFLAFRVAREYTRLVTSQISELELFATRLAHDVRSPLASVKLALDMAVRGGKYPERIPAMLSRASRTLRRVGDLVDGLLMLASISTTPDTHESASLRAVLGDLREEFMPAATESGVELEMPEAPDCRVACSPGILANIVSNLAGNAIKYMQDSDVRRVTIRATEARGVARILVEDTGPGIPIYFRPMVFEPFARGAPSGVSGLGLGLATVQRLTAALGGAVGLESQEGKGSSFWVELPMAG